jgi:hypothetical protein
VDATVLTGLAVLIPFALRDHLWSLVGSSDAAAGVPQLAELLGIFTPGIFVTSLAIESALNLHPPRPH